MTLTQVLPSGHVCSCSNRTLNCLLHTRSVFRIQPSPSQARITDDQDTCLVHTWQEQGFRSLVTQLFLGPASLGCFHCLSSASSSVVLASFVTSAAEGSGLEARQVEEEGCVAFDAFCLMKSFCPFHPNVLLSVQKSQMRTSWVCSARTARAKLHREIAGLSVLKFALGVARVPLLPQGALWPPLPLWATVKTCPRNGVKEVIDTSAMAEWETSLVRSSNWGRNDHFWHLGLLVARKKWRFRW